MPFKTDNMLILLHLLEEALERCTSGQSDGAHVAGICLQLQVDIPKRFAQYTDPGMATADFARYHRGLVALYTCSLTTQNDTIIAAVGKLLNYHERLYHARSEKRRVGKECVSTG